MHHAASGTIEAYYVGFDPEVNKNFALYQRMLFEFISWGISLNANRVVMGRTALEIKSTWVPCLSHLSTYRAHSASAGHGFPALDDSEKPAAPLQTTRAWLRRMVRKWQEKGYRSTDRLHATASLESRSKGAHNQQQQQTASR